MYKKILYRDLDNLKSISAQLYKGNMLENEITQSETEGARIQNNDGTTTGEEINFEAKINAIISAGLDGKQTHSSHEETESEESFSNTFQETKRVAYDDYLINLVEESLKNENNLKNLDDVNEFDYLSINEEFDFYDFSNVNVSLDYETLIPFVMQENMIMEDYNELEKEMKKIKTSTNQDKRKRYQKYQEMLRIKTFNKISHHLNNILNNYFLLINREKQIIILGNKDYFKIPTIIMSLNKSLDLRVFGLVTSKNSLTLTDVFAIDDPEKALRNVGSYSLENYLVNFFGFERGSKYKIIHPISIEYSAD